MVPEDASEVDASLLQPSGATKLLLRAHRVVCGPDVRHMPQALAPATLLHSARFCSGRRLSHGGRRLGLTRPASLEASPGPVTLSL